MPTVLFESHHLYYLPHFRPIIAELQGRGGYALAASIPCTVDQGEQAQFKEEIEALGVELIAAPTEEVRIQTLASRQFEVIIVGNVGQLHQIAGPRSLAVMVYHGIGLKASYYRDCSPRIDLLAVESEARLAAWQARDVDRGVLVGMTKLDPLATGPDRRLETLQRLDLDPERATVLYAPTFYPTSLPRTLAPLVEVSTRVNVMIKLHPFSWVQQRYRRQSQSAAAAAAQAPGMALAPPEDYDILPYFQAADALVTDISSTLFEYLALDRPILKTEFAALRLRHRLFPWRLRKRLDPERSAQIDFARKVRRPADLPEQVAEELAQPAALAERRNAAAKRHLYRTDGQASARLANAIEVALVEVSR